MSLASNAWVAQVFQAFLFFTASSLTQCSYYTYRYRLWFHESTGCSKWLCCSLSINIPACNHLDIMTCVIACMLQTFLDVMLLIAAVYDANSSFKVLLYASHLFIILAMLHYVVTWYIHTLILTNCCEITKLLLQNFTFIENQTF